MKTMMERFRFFGFGRAFMAGAEFDNGVPGRGGLFQLQAIRQTGAVASRNLDAQALGAGLGTIDEAIDGFDGVDGQCDHVDSPLAWCGIDFVKYISNRRAIFYKEQQYFDFKNKFSAGSRFDGGGVPTNATGLCKVYDNPRVIDRLNVETLEEGGMGYAATGFYNDGSLEGIPVDALSAPAGARGTGSAYGHLLP